MFFLCPLLPKINIIQIDQKLESIWSISIFSLKTQTHYNRHMNECLIINEKSR